MTYETTALLSWYCAKIIQNVTNTLLATYHRRMYGHPLATPTMWWKSLKEQMAPIKTEHSMSESIHYATLFSHYTACGINISSYGGAFRRDVEESPKPDEVTCATCLSNRLVSELGFDFSYDG